MSSREEFEAWLSREYPWGNEALDKAFFSGNDDNGYYTGGDFIYDGSSCADALFWAWRGWQESHKQGKAKCAALAAELNAVEAIHDDAVFITDDHYEQCPPEVQEIIRSLAVMQIPAYKAFLAEVRAQGAEMLREHPAIQLCSLTHVCDELAAQLRQGGAV